MTTPEGETAKDRRRQWYVGIVSVVALLAVLASAVLSGVLVKVTNDDHASSVKQQQKIEALERQHGEDIANASQLLQGIQAADKVLAEFAIALTNTNNAICAKVACDTPIPPLFTLPTPSAPATTPTTTPSSASHSNPPAAHAAPPGHAAPARPATTTTAQHPGHSGSAPGHNKTP